MNTTSTARIVCVSDKGIELCAAAARISTTKGSALTLLEREKDIDRDRDLIKKVLGSGHKSLIEHHVFSIAFDNVSVLVEQFLIEFRLSSFIVKSRRYVDFKDSGFYVPDALTGELREKYIAAMTARFEDYAFLTERGVPKEDARFVLPYCFYSNFYMTLNARQLLNVIFAMRFGRGQVFGELRDLGKQLSDQFEEIYPGIIEAERKHLPECKIESVWDGFESAHVVQPLTQLISAPHDAPALLNQSLAFAGRYTQAYLRELTADARPRELEALNYTFKLSGVSLSCITHFARHRIQSPMFKPVRCALSGGGYVLPQSIAQAGSEISTRYHNAFKETENNARALSAGGLNDEYVSYFALSGHTTELFFTMNARELMHFMKLRTCERAQWEIRHFSEDMLAQLRTSYPALFNCYGPGCAVTGKCPEGRLCCGHPRVLPCAGAAKP